MAARHGNQKLLLYQARHFSSPTSSLCPTFESFRLAKSAIISESDPNKLADLFVSQSSTFPRFARHRLVYHLVVRKLSRAKRYDLVERILEHQKTAPAVLPLSEGFFIRLIMLYSNAGMIDNALRTFDDLINSKEFHASEKSLCAILSALLNNKNLDKFHEVFTGVPAKTAIFPGVKSYNLALKAYCQENRVEMAKKLIEKMEKEARIFPDIFSYNVILGAYLRNKDWIGFDSVVKDVLNRGLEGNVTTYNHRILRHCKNKECARAKKLVDEMVSKGIKPNAASYNTIIDGFCIVGDLDSAVLMLERMSSDGYVSPCSFSYFTLLRHMVEEGEFDSALEICKKILKRKWVPPFEAMEGLIKGLVNISKSEEAKEMVDKMKKRLRGPAVDSWGKIEAALPL
ncbi:hypothetical protein Nepgr_000732 [Nepenthes gracilis]|uniref:Pentatricopeptide repeat-containing protein n=1 Tax=Nepenthes gracilis TaxID=150966 RepID=A0AAD3RX47_NEPGR|nr:hypothetical protein Nepgr_000732 [Nepenthes gracilis]